MSLLCWKYCPARESCGYMCSCMGRVCCVRSSSISKEEVLDDPLVNADQNSRLHVRRFSRLNSEESLEGQANASEDSELFDSRYLSPVSASAPSGKIPKKISFHRRALKTMMKKGVSTPNLQSEDGSLEGDGIYKKHKRHFGKGKHMLTSSSDDFTNEDKEESETKNHYKAMLKESRSKAKENKEKQQMIELQSSPHRVLLPHPSCRIDLEGFQDDTNSSMMLRTRQGYGSLLQIPISREEGSDFTLSDEERSENVTRSLYGESRDRLLEGDFSSTPSCASTEWDASLNDKERGQADGSSLDVGSKDNPAQECFGSISLSIRIVSPKLVSIGIHSLQGLPCRKGKDGGLCLEVLLSPWGKTVWLPLPQAQGPKVSVNSDVNIKLSHGHSKPQDSFIRICVWASSQTWKHCALGNAITTMPSMEESFTLGLYRHTQISKGYGKLEVCLEIDTSSSSQANVTLQIMKAQFSKDLVYEKSITSFRVIYRHKRDVWCRISLWSKGHRLHKESTPKMFLPVTYDPYFRSESKFSVKSSMLAFTSIVIKVLCDKGLGLGEAVLGKVILGPHLYLGVHKGDCPPGILSHWGKALTHAAPVKLWHSLYE